MTDVAVGRAALLHPPVMLHKRLGRTETVEMGQGVNLANHAESGIHGLGSVVARSISCRTDDSTVSCNRM